MIRRGFLAATQVALLASCASINDLQELRAQVSHLEAQLAAQGTQLNDRISDIGRQTTNFEGRLTRLERELEGVTLRTVTVPGDGEWHVAFANQSGSDLSLSIRLECAFLNDRCQTSDLPDLSEIRILRVLAPTDDTINFPVVENTVTVDTGPLELSSAGAVRRVVVPRGFQIVVRSQGPSDIRVRLEVR